MLVEVARMDSLPAAAHRFAAPFGRPKRAAPRFVNSLRECVLHRLHKQIGRPQRGRPFRLVEVARMDSPPSAVHRFAAHCVRLSAALRPRLNSLREYSSRHPTKKAAKWRPLMLVEVARIELASASPTLRALHAYSVFNLTACYPTGRENSQPVQ